MKVRHGRARRAGDRRRRAPGPVRRPRRRRTSSSRPSPTRALADVDAVDARRVARLRPRRRVGAGRDRRRLPSVGRASRAAPARAAASASAPLHRLLAQQVVLRRADRRSSSCGPPPPVRALRPARRSSASSSTARWSAAPPASCAPARPPCARSRRLPALLRRAAALGVAGRRPLLPALELMTLTSILLWLPLAAGAARRAAARRERRRLVALVGSTRRARPTRSSLVVRLRPRRGGLQFVTDHDVDLRSSGIHYKLGLDGLNLFLVVARPTLLFAAVDDRGAELREREPPAPLLLPPRARRDGRARRVLRPGPPALRRLLRPDARPVLLPDRAAGATGPTRVRATTKLVIYTLVGSLLMLAAAIATACSPARGGDRLLRLLRPRTRTALPAARRTGSSCASPRRSS